MLRYKRVDIAIFAALLCLLEAASFWAAGVFKGEVYGFSPMLFIALLMLARWGKLGVAYAALGGAVYCYLHGANPVQYAVYIFGNLAVAVNLLWVRVAGVRRVRASMALTGLYCLTGWLGVCIGRTLISGLLGQGFWLGRFLAAEALGAAITLIAFEVARRQDGLFEPQAEYLLRMQEEQMKGAR